MNEPKNSTKGGRDLADHYRPLALPAVAAAFAVKRPAVALAVRGDALINRKTTVDGFWTPDHDDDF